MSEAVRDALYARFAELAAQTQEVNDLATLAHAYAAVRNAERKQ